jgi:predicted DNA-binding transcriptional regulator AlpA
MIDRLIDIKELADRLRIPPKTIRNKLSNGTWPIAPLRIGKALRWRESDVNAMIADPPCTSLRRVGHAYEPGHKITR